MNPPGKIYDAAIAGGGLAGLTLAIQLARQQRNVILFEKEQYPFHKVCGEYISMESRDFLLRCGVNLNPLDLPRITCLMVTAPNGNAIKHKLVPGGFGISRYLLDNLLVGQARASGVVVKEACKVTDVLYDQYFSFATTQGNYMSNLAFGSCGKRSNLDIKLKRAFIQQKQKGQNNYIAVKYHIKINRPADLIELHNFENGYCGVSKIEDEKHCLCYLTTEKNLKDADHDIRAMERKKLYKNPHLQKYFEESHFLFDAPLVISQVNFQKRSRSENHMIMLGDAAGLITPLCGNGMSMAMRASHILAGLVAALDSGSSLVQLETAYNKAWEKEFGSRLLVGRAIQQMFGAEKLTNLFIGALKPFPFLIDKLVALTHGKPF